MKIIAIDPHGDDIPLFASFLALRHKPLVLVTHLSVPKEEVDQAMDALGCEWAECPLDRIDASEDDDLLILPAWEKEGLPEHNLVATIGDPFPNRISYLTYAGHPRQKSRGREVEFEPEWIWAKLRALAAFESQAATPSHVHFLQDLREYVA